VSEHTLLVLVAVGQGIGLVLLVIVLAAKWLNRTAFTKVIAEARNEAITHYNEAMSLLQAVRDMATSARDNRKETAVVVGQVREQLGEHPTREELVKTLEEVPQKTAQKVIEQLPDSRDDWRGHEGKPM